jgi:hypothetical protein
MYQGPYGASPSIAFLCSLCAKYEDHHFSAFFLAACADGAGGFLPGVPLGCLGVCRDEDRV